jgi:hypothetical protein
VADVVGQSAFSKLERAFALRDELRDLLAGQLSAPREVSRRDNSGERTSRIVWAEWVLESTPDYTAAALLLGDVVHNLRAAMDHAIWAITPNDVQDTSPTDISFPLYSRENKYEGRGRRLMGRDPISGSLAMKKRRPMPRRGVKPDLDIVGPRGRFIDVGGDADAQHAAGVGIDE